MNKFKSCEGDSSISNLDIKSEIDFKDEPITSDVEFNFKNDLNFASKEYQEQLSCRTGDIFSSRLFDRVSEKVNKEMYETDVQQMRVKHVDKEINDHNINSHLDKESFYHRIQDFEFPEVLNSMLNLSNMVKNEDLQKTFTDGYGLLDIPSLVSLNSSNKSIKNKKTEERKDIPMEASTSQEDSQLLEKFRCSLCGYKSNRKGHLNRHLLTHLDAKLFKCPECDYECIQKTTLKLHLLAHSNTKLFKCVECSCECGRKGDLKRHLLIHSNTKLFKCLECDCECVQKCHLRSHLLTHSNTKLFKCSECDFECLVKCNLKRHLLTHSNNKLFKCADCGYECNRKEYLKLHLLTHSNTKLFKCAKCDFECNRKGSLSRHLLTHSNLKCSECDYECYVKSTFKQHLLTHITKEKESVKS